MLKRLELLSSCEAKVQFNFDHFSLQVEVHAAKRFPSTRFLLQKTANGWT